MPFTVASSQPRQTVLTAAGSIGQASGELLRQIGENETDERFQVMRGLLVTVRTVQFCTEEVPAQNQAVQSVVRKC